jgi:septal ring factor EnvC (AmiA/AmiB activator)
MIKPTMTVAAILAALFPNSEKAISEKLTQEEFNAFAADAQEAQTRLDAQATGNEALNGDLTAAKADAAKAEAALTAMQAERDTAQAALATANTTIAGLQPKAAQWDAYKASLTATVVAEDSTNKGKDKADSGLSAKDQAHLERLAELKEKYPTLMADIDVPTQA